jgi:hypothetical protein
MKSKLEKFKKFEISGDKIIGGTGHSEECGALCAPASSNPDVWLECLRFCDKFPPQIQ